MDLFRRIASIINGSGKDTSSPSDLTGHSRTNDNSINKKRMLSDAIIATLRSNYFGQHVSFNNKLLTIWIQDQLFYDSIIESDFMTELTTSLNDELGFTFGAIEIKADNIPDGAQLTGILNDVFLQLSPYNFTPTVRTAQISPVEGYGSTLEPVYILDSKEIGRMPNQRYNIGIGKQVVIAGMYRNNQIAIDDNTMSPQFEKNKYVSRSHAYISYSDQYGFMLNVEPSGTRMAGKRTRILRGNTIIDMNNVDLPEQLQDNDIIELSKSVSLLFKQL